MNRPENFQPAVGVSLALTLTRNEMLYALNEADKFLLSIVLVGETDALEGPSYLRNPFEAEPAWGGASINFDVKELLRRAEPQ